jgi:hypothetical protein
MSLRANPYTPVVAGLALDPFEPRAEAFARARAWREHRFLTGQRPGRGLVSLYEKDFPEFTSTDFWADLQAATPEDPRQHTRLSALLAAANLEARTREFSINITRVQASASLHFEDEDIPWRRAPARWPLIAEVPRRHALEESWRGILRSEISPQLERWQEALRAHLIPLGASDWLAFWSNLRGIDAEATAKFARSVLEQTAEVYGNSLGVYLGQLDLPIDDLWTSDADRAFRAPRFDAEFPERTRQPTLIRVLRDLGIELEEQTDLHIDYDFADTGVKCLPLDIPGDVHVLLRLIGGWQDWAHSLRGTGMAEHLVHADPSLRVWERWLGDETPTTGYGFLLEGLLRDRTWLTSRLEYAASDDFRVIAHLAWLYRVRRAAASTLYEQRVWQAEPGTSLAADFEESLSSATRVRHFSDEYLGLLLDAPWSTLQQAMMLRAEVFAAQLRLYLRHEFDEEWWRSNRAARFITDELWRTGRRHSAEELLGFMGYEGFDPTILTAEILEVLQPL